MFRFVCCCVTVVFSPTPHFYPPVVVSNVAVTSGSRGQCARSTSQPDDSLDDSVLFPPLGAKNLKKKPFSPKKKSSPEKQSLGWPRSAAIPLNSRSHFCFKCRLNKLSLVERWKLKIQMSSVCFSTNILNSFVRDFYRIASPSTRFTLLSTWLRLVVGLAGLYLHFGCWTLADASNHQELDPPLAQRLFTSSSSTKSLPTPLAIMLNLIPDMHRPSDGQIELSPEQNQLIEHIFLAGLNASDYLLNVLEPRLYREG